MDIRSPELADLFNRKHFDAVNHQAGRGNVRLSVDKPRDYADVNIIGGLNVLQCCADLHVRKFIYSSTGGCVFGELAYVPADELHPISPIEPYGASKASFELFLPVFAQLHNVDYTILRYPNVYGARQNPDGEAGVVSIFSKRMLLGQPVVISGDGEQERDYLYVSDVVKANVAVLEDGHRQVYNLGWGRGVTVNEIFVRLKAITSYSKEVEHGPARIGEVRRSMLDSSRIRQALGWEPRVDLDEGLRLTSEFIREQLQIDAATTRPNGH